MDEWNDKNNWKLALSMILFIIAAFVVATITLYSHVVLYLFGISTFLLGICLIIDVNNKTIEKPRKTTTPKSRKKKQKETKL